MAVTITTITDLHTLVAKWFETNIVQSRLTGDKSRQWSTGALALPSAGANTMVQAALRAFIDRSDLNAEYNSQYNKKEISDKHDLVAIKVEISVLYSFLKCFVERHKTRLMFYRDDLSQKGARIMYNVKLSEEYHNQVKQELQA
jgi:hypothetical protein